MITSLFFSPTDFTDWHGFVFLVATNALGIEAASFASHAGAGTGIGDGNWGLGTGTGNGSGESEQRYSGKPDGFAGTPKVRRRKSGDVFCSLIAIQVCQYFVK